MHVALKHTTTNTHFCHICPVSFPTQTQLAHHLVKHTDATIKCVNQKCKLVFKTTTTQKTHYVRCHMNKTELFKRLRKDTDSCKCFSCGEIFTLNAVIYHVSGCSPLSPFNKAAIVPVPQQPDKASCVSCPETFPTHEQLAHHVVTQHPNTELKCIQVDCEKTFKNTAAQKKHFARFHMDKSLLYKKLPDGSFACISCDVVLKSSAIARHVADCSPLSPFGKDMVLNQADADIFSSFQELEDIPDDIFQDIIPNQAHHEIAPNQTNTFDIFQENVPILDDIPDDICQELLDLYSN